VSENDQPFKYKVDAEENDDDSDTDNRNGGHEPKVEVLFGYE